MKYIILNQRLNLRLEIVFFIINIYKNYKKKSYSDSLFICAEKTGGGVSGDGRMSKVVFEARPSVSSSRSSSGRSDNKVLSRVGMIMVC